MKKYQLKPEIVQAEFLIPGKGEVPEGVVAHTALDGMRWYWWGGFCLHHPEGCWIILHEDGQKTFLPDSAFRATYDEVPDATGASPLNVHSVGSAEVAPGGGTPLTDEAIESVVSSAETHK